MQKLGLDTKCGLVFVTPRTYGHLYDSGLEGFGDASTTSGGVPETFICPTA